jgi:dihydroflavonol-4-reductase
MSEDRGLVLVTGGTGYLGSWCVVRLLQQGWRVRATVRNLAREGELRTAVARETDAGDRLEVVAADLTSDEGWPRALAGCQYVLHVASPFPAAQPRDEDELIRPAREGTLRVLRSAVAAGVKRVVLTSSVAAIAYGHPADRYRANSPPMTEADWTDVNGPHVTPYAKSKTLAERAAREFIAREGGATELVSVNPTGIFGPTLTPDIGTSMIIIERLLKGALPGLPNIGLQVVDVRDTADLHLLVMTAPGVAGGRFAATSDFYWFHEFAALLRKAVPDLAGKVPTRRLPDWLITPVGWFDPQARAISGELGRVRRTSDAAARALGWKTHPTLETLADSARSLVALGVVKV